VKRASCIVLVSVVVAAGTWMLGWWSVPVAALVAGLLGCRASLVSVASTLAWLALLLVDAAQGNLSRVSTTLGGIIGVPAAAALFLTLLLPALLGWSAASLGNAARARRATSRPPS
jgi:hypothetical protein